MLFIPTTVSYEGTYENPGCDLMASGPPAHTDK